MKIIGIAGHAESGKSTFANFLKEALELKNYRVLLINYGDYVKFIAKQYYNWDGEKNEIGRALLQHIGTEQGRNTVDKNIWVDMVINTVKVAKEDYDIAIVADCRFPNEFDRWREQNCEIITVKMQRINHQNKLTEEQRKHESETSLDNYTVENIIENNGNLEDLRNMAQSLADYYFEDRK